MNTVLLILGLTIIYYVVLFYLDNKRKKAFQLTKNNAIGKTAELPVIEETEPTDLFGKTEPIEEPTEIPAPTTIVQKAIAAKNVVYQHSAKHLKEDLDELAVHLDNEQTQFVNRLRTGGQTIETKKDDLVESLRKANEEEIIGEEEITAFIKTPKLKI